MDLSSLGWSTRLDTLFEPFLNLDLTPARVMADGPPPLRVAGEGGELAAAVAGNLLPTDTQAPPVIGDWVAVDTANDPPVVRAILPRTGLLVRRRPGGVLNAQPLSANINTVLIVEPLDRGPNARRIERAAAIAWDCGATPVVVLSKCDLSADLAAAVTTARGGAGLIDAVAVSAATGRGFDELTAHLAPGTTAVCLGPSGAGKSSIVNRLLGSDALATAAVRGTDRKGRHKTTRRQLVVLPSDACIIDTPGVRELGLWLDRDGVDVAFADITAMARGCRFRDCGHQNEPGCAVRAAVQAGELDEGRLLGYLKLRLEASTLAMRRTTEGRHRERQAGRRFARLVRAEKRRKGSA